MQRNTNRVLPAVVASTLGLGMSIVAFTPAAAEIPEGPVAAYDFMTAPDDQTTVANDADSDFGAAEVHNGSAQRWNDSGLVLSGGAKDGDGSWVELPEDVLADAGSATVQLEVKPDASMLQEYHFLWNIGNDSSDTEYFFSSLACKEGRAPLVGFKESGDEDLIQASSCAVEPDRWQSVTAVIDGDDDTAALYIDGEQVAKGAVAGGPELIEDQSLNAIARSPWPDELFKGEVANFRVYDRALSDDAVQQISKEDAALHEDELTAAADAVLDAEDIEDVQVDESYIPLPKAGGAISWESSNEDVIDLDGRVTRPHSGQDAVEVELTASTSVRGFTASRTITATVLPENRSEADLVADLAAGYAVPSRVQDGSELPQIPRGASVSLSAEGGLEVAGNTVTSADGTTTSGTVTAEVTLDDSDESVTKTFDVEVLADDESTNVLSYHREATSHETANNGDVAYSMHLALEDGDAWDPLNGNYGIFFARTTELPEDAVDVKLGTHRSLRSPSIFHRDDGSYGIVAVRTEQGSDKADESGKSSILLASSDDLLDYEESPDSKSIVDVGETNGVNEPYVVYDSDADVYVVGWQDDNGIPKYTTFAELEDSSSEHGDVRVGEIAQFGGVDEAEGVDNYVPGHTIAIDDEQAEKLQVRFGRIVNSDAEPFDDVTVDAGAAEEDLGLPEEVNLSYSDGSDNTLPIDEWDLSDVDLSSEGSYDAVAKIKQTEYPMPFAEERADPVMEKWEWEQKDGTETKYLMIATNDIHGDNVGQNGNPKMPVRMGDSITELADTPGDDSGLIDDSGNNPKENVILEAGDKNADGETITGSLWAPEFHVIDGTLSILFMPSYNNDWQDGAAAIMQLKQDDEGYDLDPTEPASWTVPETVTRANGEPLSLRTDGTRGMSLDMTHFEDEKGESYYAWQQLGAVYLASMDPEDPATVTSDPVLVVSPEYAWDNAIAEGPNVVHHDGTLFMIYSGSGVGPTYTTGLAFADASGDADLTDPESWEKLNYPIQKSSLFNGEWQLGTGHGMWSEDEDGAMIYVFHAYAQDTDGYSNFSGRDMFIRRVHWASDGLPIFDMDLKEEVAEDIDVTLTVHVEGGAGSDQTGDDGSSQDGSGNDGSSQDGSAQDGSTEDGAAQDGQSTDGDSDSGDAAPGDQDDLPRTGAEIAALIGLALILALAGGITLVARKRMGAK